MPDPSPDTQRPAPGNPFHRLFRCASIRVFSLTPDSLAVLADHMEKLGVNLAQGLMPPTFPPDLTRKP